MNVHKLDMIYFSVLVLKRSVFSQLRKLNVFVFPLFFLPNSGSIDGNNQLVIKGRFQQKQIENVLRRYISKLVFTTK